jgi:hypothetical protein
MKFKKIIQLFFYTIVLSNYLNGQALLKRALTFEEKKNKVICAYEYNGSGHYSFIKLLLYENGDFYYSIYSANQNIFSEGKWSKKGKVLYLTSSIQNNNLPVDLTYSTDTSKIIGGLRVGIIKNAKGQELNEGMVRINNDTTKCVPAWGICTGIYKTIDSIKIYFGNGISSKWIKVDKKDWELIIPIVKVDFSIPSYMTLNNRKYLIQKSSIQLIK